MKKIYLTAMGHYHPETVIENSFFDQLEIGSDGDWIQDRTGIVARRTVMKPHHITALSNKQLSYKSLFSDSDVMTAADMSAHAWGLLRERAPWVSHTAGLDCISCGTSVPDFDIPANASFIAKKIGINAFTCDINSACSSFVVNVHWHRMFLNSGNGKSSAIFTPERYSTRLNFEDRSSCILFGDGAACALLETENAKGFEVLDTAVWSDPSQAEMVVIPAFDGHFWQNGKAVQKFAITKTMEAVTTILERNRLTVKDVRYVIGHQANLRMLSSSVEKLGLSAREHLYNVDQFGNQGAAGAPCVLSQNWDRFQSGDIVVVAVVGAGLTWGSLLLKYL
jgi:3-oxoacyl-[acyl-carrier-protein] synthase-3